MTWKQELAALLRLQIAQIGKEESRALPKHFYRDPSEHVEFESEIRRREAAKQKRKEKR